MGPKGTLQSQVGARYRRQKTRARELRERVSRDRYVRQLAAQRKIKCSREKIRRQVERSTLRGRAARVRIERSRERAHERAKLAPGRAQDASSRVARQAERVRRGGRNPGELRGTGTGYRLPAPRAGNGNS
jgi:hypothetical protein